MITITPVIHDIVSNDIHLGTRIITFTPVIHDILSMILNQVPT